MMTSKELTRKIDSIARRNATLRQDLHVVMCNVAGHVYEHGNVVLTTNLVRMLAATKGFDKVAILKWLGEYAFVRFDKDGKPSINKAKRNEADFADGAAVVAHLLEHAPRWDEDAITEAKAAKVLDPAARIESLAKAVEKADDVSMNMAAIEAAIAHLQDALTAKARIKSVLAA